MNILSARILNCHRDRYFGRVEAWIAVTIQYHPSLPPRSTTVLAQTAAKPGNLRARLMKDARKVAVLLHRLDRMKQPSMPSEKLAA